MSSTYAVLEISEPAFAEIAKRMKDAGYSHAILQDKKYGTQIDMGGIALAVEPLRLIPESPMKERGGEAQRSIRDTIFPHYLVTVGRHRSLYSLSDGRLKVGVDRYKDCLKKVNGDHSRATELMILAIDNFSSSKFHMGLEKPEKYLGKKPTKYTDWTAHLFKTTETLEKWLSFNAEED